MFYYQQTKESRVPPTFCGLKTALLLLKLLSFAFSFLAFNGGHGTIASLQVLSCLW